MSRTELAPMLVDANVWVYAHNAADPRHERCVELLRRVARGEVRAAITEQVVAEFVACLSDPRSGLAVSPGVAAGAAARVLRWRHLRYVSPTRRSTALAVTLIARHTLRAGEVHDARLAALVLARRLPGIYTFDRGFRRFESDGVRVLEP